MTKETQRQVPDEDMFAQKVQFLVTKELCNPGFCQQLADQLWDSASMTERSGILAVQALFADDPVESEQFARLTLLARFIDSEEGTALVVADAKQLDELEAMLAES